MKSMYYVITDHKIIKEKSLKKLFKKHNLSFDDHEFQIFGNDKVIKVTNRDIDFLKDKALIESGCIDNMFKIENGNKWPVLATMIITIIIMLQSCGQMMSGMGAG